ncbi:flagellar biosynthetic protein FliO [Ectobacillus sp. sgz5001026]|jgi:flagellar protein FliO/FliZ|uniref:flagellar biosynthetic protein FliO n=1 Tax=Ectobacillus sp. sgz5001026 TaxID=3242473 RepID=UPI0036D24F93
MIKWNKLLLSFLLVFLVCSMPSAKAKEGTVYQQYNDTSSQQKNTPAASSPAPAPSVVPYIFQFIGSFVLIIVLIYVLSKVLSKKATKIRDSGPFHAIGSYSLGNNRSVQLLMIGNTMYIVGVGENIGLIRTIPPGEEQKELLEAIASATDENEAKWTLQSFASAEKWNAILKQQMRKLDRNTLPRNKDKEPKDGGKDN